MKIEVLYIDGCPHFKPTVEAVKEVLRQCDLTLPVITTKVESQDMALNTRFLGSPTVRIDGLDIEPSTRNQTAFGMMCRTYHGSDGVPSEDLIRSAITKAAAISSTRTRIAFGHHCRRYRYRRLSSPDP